MTAWSSRYSPSWNAPAAPAAAASTGRRAAAVDADGQADQRPNSRRRRRRPPVSIMTPEPGSRGAAGAAPAAGSQRRRVRHPAPRPAAAIGNAHPARPPRHCAGCGQEAAGAAEAAARGAAGSARACGAIQPQPRRRQPPNNRRDAFKSHRRSLNFEPCHYISSSLPSAASPSRNSRAGSPNACDRQEKGPAAPSYPRHPDDAEARRRDSRRRFAVLGDPRRNRRARENHRDRAVPRQGRHRTMPAGDAAEGDRGARRGRCARSRAGAISADDAAPPDLGKAAASVAAMPEPMRRELRDLGLL